MTRTRRPRTALVGDVASSAATTSERGSIGSTRAIADANFSANAAQEGKRSIIVGVPPNYPPRKINGISVGCFLTPDTTKNDFTHPPNFKSKINELVGEYPVDVKNFRTDRKDWLKDEIFKMSEKQWKVVHWLLKEQEWDYFHFVDIGLDRMHHGFWNHFDEKHVLFQPDNPYRNAIPEYYLWLDEQIGKALELLDQDTVVLVVSDHGAQRLDGGIAINEWLIREGPLVLNEYPKELTPFDKLSTIVNWQDGNSSGSRTALISQPSQHSVPRPDRNLPR